MPSIDEDLLVDLQQSGRTLLFAEQNNGYLWQNFLKVMYRRGIPIDAAKVRTVNTLSADGRAQFIHSATYEELVEVFNLSASKLAQTARTIMEQDA
jgi:hypothetical protein